MASDHSGEPSPSSATDHVETHFDAWADWLKQYSAVPLRMCWKSEQVPVCWKPFWVEGQPSVLLETGLQAAQAQETAQAQTVPAQLEPATLLGLEIHETLTGWEDWAESAQRGQFGRWEPRKFYRGTPVEIWEQWKSQWRAPDPTPGTPFEGGVMGLLSYDLNRIFERIPNLAQDDLDLPYYLFYLPKTVLRYDHQSGIVHAVRWFYPNAQTARRNPQQIWHEELSSLKMLHKVWDHACRDQHAGIGPLPDSPLQEAVSGSKTFDLEGYSSAVERIQEYITAGHSYQVNLALRQSEPTEIAGWKLYEAVRRVNPSPYMGLWRHPEFELVCGSPELLVKKSGHLISSRPIAGTRPRGLSADEDRLLSHELQEHPKENAEHLMLVDLIRNDLGRVCKHGTVHVPEFMVQEHYSHVIHLVSQVEGEWDPDQSVWNLIPAVFPGGTITGAPKIRTMQIIEELEPVRRHFYTGSMGWVSFSGDMEWNILIRTLLLKNQIAHLHTGAGVVADSLPEKEYLECLQKGKALWKALSLACWWEQNQG